MVRSNLFLAQHTIVRDQMKWLPYCFEWTPPSIKCWPYIDAGYIRECIANKRRVANQRLVKYQLARYSAVDETLRVPVAQPFDVSSTLRAISEELGARRVAWVDK